MKAKAATSDNVAATHQIERWDIDRLLPYARNARTHSDKQVAQIAASIREWGWTFPLLIDHEGMVIAGHGRLAAARLLKMTQVPVIVARGWTDAQKRAYVLADNKLAENAGWDNELLANELQALDADQFDLLKIGFSAAELKDALAPDGEDGGVAFSGDSIFEIVVTCADEAEQTLLLERLAKEGLRVRALMA